MKTTLLLVRPLGVTAVSLMRAAVALAILILAAGTFAGWQIGTRDISDERALSEAGAKLCFGEPVDQLESSDQRLLRYLWERGSRARS
jgi:hypothetical protein